MDRLQACAAAFQRLLPVEYFIVIARKRKAVELRIRFTEHDLHHLLGLGKLKDLRIATMKRQKAFQAMLAGAVDEAFVRQSRYYHLIENRLAPLTALESLLDDNRLVFRYNEKLYPYSLIKADYLLTTPFQQNDVFIFLSQHETMTHYFCRSFFPKEKVDFSKGQPRYTMLYKEKIDRATGEKVVQYDRGVWS